MRFKASLFPKAPRRNYAWVRFSAVPMWAWFPLMVATFSLSCDEDPTGPYDDTPIVRLDVTPYGTDLEGVGSNVRLSATGRKNKGKVIENPKVTWTSLNPAVAAVDRVTGKVTAVASGQAVISAKGKGAKGHAIVTVSVPGVPAVTEWKVEMAPVVTLTSVWAHSPTDVFAIGSAGTFLHYDGATWRHFPEVPGTLDGLSGTAPDDLYSTFRIPGQLNSVVHFDGSGWEIVAEAENRLKDIWVAPTGEVFAAGYNGGVQFDGTNWTPIGTDPIASFYGVAGSSAQDVYAVGLGSSAGVAWRYDGETWSLTPGYPDRLFNVWAASPTDVFFTGQSGYDGVIRFDGVSWIEEDLPTTACLGEMWGSAGDDLFMAGYRDGAICHYDGSSWTEMESGTDVDLYDVMGTASNNVYAVGQYGVVLQYDGSRWTTIRERPGEPLWLSDVWVASDNHVLVLGEKAFLQFDGTAWETRSDEIAGEVRDLWGASTENAYAVMAFGDVLYFDGNGWAELDSGGENYNGIWGASPTDIWVVGWDGVVRHFDGEQWSDFKSPGPVHLRTVWGTSRYDLVTAGDRGRIFRHDGLGWTEEETGTEENLHDIWGASSDDAFAVGRKGTILRYDGHRWVLMDSGTDQDLRAVWGTSSADVYAVGHNLVLHYDGARWAPLPQPIPEQIGYEGIWGRSNTDVFMVGGRGTVLRGIR